MNNFPMSGSVLGGDIIQHLYRPNIETIHSLTNSLPNSTGPAVEPSILNSMYQSVMSNRNLAIPFILISFGPFTSGCVRIISNGLNVFFTNTFLTLKNFAVKV
jgi:hypothetical protein